MKQEVFFEATENISLIKDMMERTSKSFITFSKIFIYWGLFFLVYSGITVVLRVNKEKITGVNFKSALLIYVLMVCVFVISAAFIYYNISKKVPLVGLEKTLMKVWLLIIVMNMIPIKVAFENSQLGLGEGSSIIRLTSNPTVMLFSLAIGLILTSLLANYKQPKIVGFVFIGFSVFYAYNQFSSIDTFFTYLHLIILPVTLLYLGFFLKFKQVRGD